MSSARRIGPYDIVREIARGGMGIVYEVRHPTLDRRLALKLILNVTGPRAVDLVRRFEREAEILARCDRHPHVLKVHQLGKLDDRLYLVTEFIDGEPLQRAIPMDPRRAATVIRKVADALAYVHGRGVLHRDIKPDNILLRSDEPDSPVLVDFGLAWVDDVERLTRTGTTLGTPAFMSPEQASGGAGAGLDERSDVYSLGATLYATLTGDVPFDADSMSALVAKILTERARPPGEVTEGIPRALDAICLHALEKNPEKRYPDAAALRDDLDRFLRGEAPHALALVPRPPRARIRRALFAAFGAAALVVSVGVGVVFVQGHRQRVAYEGTLEAASEAARAAAKARRTADGPATLAALEQALATLGATRAPPGTAEAPAQRARVVAALLRAESLAREVGAPDERARAQTIAASAAREYMAAAASLGLNAGAGSTPGSPELENLGEREPALAAALASWVANEDVVRALLARPEPREPSRAARLDRARALLALGDPLLARKVADLVTGDDAVALEARLLAARASLESGDVTRARTLALGIVAPGAEPALRARAGALLAEVELARGEPTAAQDAIDAVPDRGRSEHGPEVGAELALARAEVGLARRAPADVVVQELDALEKKLRDPTLAPRVAELLGRARLVAELEAVSKRSELPTLDAARAALARAVELGGKPGGGEARSVVARALLELAALDETRGHAAEAQKARVRAATLAPPSVEAALSLVDELGAPRGAVAGDVARALERTAGAIADEPVAGALRALASTARSGTPPRNALVAIEAAAAGAMSARARGALSLLFARLAPHPERPDALARTATELLRRSGALDAILLELGRERTALACHAESYLLHSVALSRARDRNDHPSTWGRGAAGEIADGLAAERGALERADAPVACVALELALALRPGLVPAAREQARAVAQALRGARPDLDEAKDLADEAPLARSFAGADGGAARARAAFAAVEPLELPPEPLARAELLLARGRLLVAAGRTADAVAALGRAHEEGVALWTALRGSARPPYASLARALGVASASIEDLGSAQSGALEASGARGEAAQDLDERGTWIVSALAAGETLNTLEEQLGDFGDKAAISAGKVATQRADAFNKLCCAPHCTDVLGKCAASELTAGQVVSSYETLHRAFEVRGPLPVVLMVLRREFGPHFRKEGAMSQLTVEELKAASDASPDDAVALAASATRALYGLRSDPDPGTRRAAALRIDDDLARARRLSPGFVALEAFRAFADVASGEIERARSRFARLEELTRYGVRPRKHVQLFAAACYARFGDRDDARRALEALRDGKEVDRFDSVAVRGEAFDDVRAIPELVPLVEEIDRLYLGTAPPDGH